MEFPYKTIFATNCQIKALLDTKERQTAIASLNNIPVDLEENSDLLGISFEAALANCINANDDGMSAENLVEVAKNFLFKPLNLDHHRKFTCGVITGYSFTKYGSGELMTEEEAKASKDKFCISLTGVLWRLVNKDLASLIEDTSEVHASWEIGFSTNNLILLPKGKTDYKDGLIITAEDKDFNKISECLRANGGGGTWGEFRVCRDIILPALPLGIGLTENPAADVKNVVAIIKNVISAKIEEHPEDCDCEDCMDGKKMDEVIISEEKSEIWVCPHCKDKIQEKSLSGWDEENRASQHTCGGWVIHPELSEAEKEFMKNLESKSEVEVEIEIKPDSENEDEMDKEGECECESPEPQESEGKKSCAKCGKKMKDSMAQLADIDKKFTVSSSELNKSLKNIGELFSISSENINKITQYIIEISKNSSTEAISTVINDKKPNKTMLTAIADINDEYLKTAQATEIREFLEKCAAESATKAAEQLKAIETEKGSIAADLEKAKTELAAAKAELDKLNQEKSAAAAQELFNKRMAYFDEKFDLCEDAKKAIVARVRDIKDDEAFATYQKEMDIFLKGKEKGQKQSVASITDDKALENALKNAEAQKIEVTPGAVKDEPKSLFDKFKKAFELNSENFISR